VIKHSDRLPEKQICSSKLVLELLMQKNNKYKVYRNAKKQIDMTQNLQ